MLKKLVVLLSLTSVCVLSGCGASTNPQADACSEVKQVLSNYPALMANTVTDPAAVKGMVEQDIQKLTLVGNSLSAGPQRDYVLGLAKDFSDAIGSDSISGMMKLASDLTPAQIQILCPK